MELDYAQIGKHIAARRKELGLKQTEVCDKAGINDKYLSCIERATSIPSLEVVIRLAQALDTTPDFFLVDSARHESNAWQGTAELLRNMSPRKLELAMIRIRVRSGMAECQGQGGANWKASSNRPGFTRHIFEALPSIPKGAVECFGIG